MMSKNIQNHQTNRKQKESKLIHRETATLDKYIKRLLIEKTTRTKIQTR
jgi:hypothetical protein